MFLADDYAAINRAMAETGRRESDASSFHDFALTHGRALFRPHPWRDGWHIKAICSAMDAAVDGRVNRLVISMPPSFGKSTLASVLLPLWWRLRRPEACVLTVSAHLSLALSHGMRSLALARNTGMSEDRARLVGSLSGAVPSVRADLVVLDDPQDSAAMDSPCQRAADWAAFTQQIQTRLKSGGVIVLLQTRLHRHDLAGRLLEHGGWTHLRLPLLGDHEANETPEIGFRDPRAHGDILWPEGMDNMFVDRMFRNLSPAKAVAMLQQRPMVE